MIESIKAVDNLEEILKVDGLDDTVNNMMVTEGHGTVFMV